MKQFCLSGRALSIVCFISIFVPGIAQQSPPKRHPENDNGWSTMSGNDLLPLCEASVDHMDGRPSPAKATDEMRCLFYVQGYLDGITGSFLAQNASVPLPLCFPDGANTGQMIRVITKWLHDHPERLHEPAYSLTFAAIHASFACPAANSSPKN